MEQESPLENRRLKPNETRHEDRSNIRRRSERRRQSEATRNLSLANPRFLFPPVMALCAHYVNGTTIRELLKLGDSAHTCNALSGNSVRTEGHSVRWGLGLASRDGIPTYRISRHIISDS